MLVVSNALKMKAAPYGSYSNIEYEDAAGYKDDGRHMNPKRYNGFPTAASSLQSADIAPDQALDRVRLKNLYPLNENGNLPQGTSPIPDWRRKKGETEGQMRNTRWSGEGAGHPKSNYQEGASNYFHGSRNSRFGESLSHYNEYDVPKTFEYLERDRAELLRKLIELEDQLLRSGNAGEQGKQGHRIERSKYHHEPFRSSGDWHQGNSSISSSASRMADKVVTNVSLYHEKHPYNERHSLTMHESYLSSGSSNDMKRYGEYFNSQILRRGTTYTPAQYQEFSPYHCLSPLRSADTADPRMSGSPHFYNPLHQPDCSCFRCYNSNLNPPPPVQSRSPVNTRYTDLSSNPKFYRQKDAQLGYNSENSNSSLAMGGQINHVRGPSDSTVDEVSRLYPESTTPVKVKRSFHPIAGGAPFVTCGNCFELLQLRREILKLNNPQQKIQCGACSYLTYVFVEGKKLVFSIHKKSIQISDDMKSGSNMDEAKENSKDLEHISNEAVEEMLHTRGPSQTSKSFHSDDFCYSVHDERIGDSEQVEQASNIVLEETTEDPNKLEVSSIEAMGKTLSNHCPKNEDNKNLHYDDHNRSGHESPLMNNAPVSSEPIYASLSNKSLDAHSLLSAVDSEDDNPVECATAQEELANSDDASDELIPPSSTISARRGHHGYAPSKHAVYWFGTHSQIIRAQNEEDDSEKSIPSANFVREISAETETETETETEILQHETSKANSPSDNIGGSKFEDPPSINNGGFVAETVKDRVMKMAMSIKYAEEKCDVRINEHPIPDHLVKKAEDLAGPILPGNYWYDFRAGFWGISGGPCLGIIPPKIQQFDYPVFKNCSGGTTGVVVNGRELHKKDLALLHSRGLPIESGKSYIVEISGRVQDENSSEELYSLGPLAPTIERLKRGFGMKGPRHH